MSMQLKAAKMGPRGFRGRAQIVRGDPGLFGAIGGAIKGVFTGGLPGALAGAVSGWKSTGASPSSMANAPRPGIGPISMAAPGGGTAVVRSPGLTGTLQRLVPGGATGYEVAAGPLTRPAGYRANKTSYFLKDGTYVEKGTRWVKIRRRNPLNPRALDRALGRVKSAKRLSKKLSKVTIRAG